MKKYIPTLLIMGGVFLGGNVKAEITLRCDLITPYTYMPRHKSCYSACEDYAQKNGWKKWTTTYEKIDPKAKPSQGCEITQTHVNEAKKTKDASFRACVCKDTTGGSEKNSPEIPLKPIQKKQN